MTINEMKETVYVYTSPTSGRPSPSMTNEMWQQKFELMKSIIIPSRFKKLVNQYQKESVYYDDDSYETYDGLTNWQTYSGYINDSLQDMRDGNRILAWYTYQIRDLLRFEHDRLRTRYNPKYQEFECWLSEEKL